MVKMTGVFIGSVIAAALLALLVLPFEIFARVFRRF
jgi:hypothetical protein